MYNQPSREAHARSLSIVNRPLFWARVFVLGLLMVFSLAGPQAKSSAQDANQTLRGETIDATRAGGAFVRSCPDCYTARDVCVNNGGSNCDAQLLACLASCQ